MTAVIGPASELDTLDALRVHIIGRTVELSLPTSFLVDAAGAVRILYVGPVGPQALLDDLDRHVVRAQPAHRRSAYTGRWYYNVPRNFQALAEKLKSRGCEADYQYYLTMAIDRLKQRQGTPRRP